MTQQLEFKKPRIRATADGFVNLYNGMGGGNSISGNNHWTHGGFLGAAYLDTLFRESWLAQAICAYPAEDATREWRRFSGKNAEKIQRAEKKLGLQQHVKNARIYANVYGGAGILMITGQPLDEPLNLNKIKKGDLKRFLVLDRFDLAAQDLNMLNPMAENFLKPTFFTLPQGSQRIHYSHIARFEGIELPRRLKMMDHGWGDSVLRKLIQDLSGVAGSFMGVAELMQQANVDTITKEGLSDEFASEDESKIIERYRIFNLMKSNFGLALLDGSEVLNRMTLNLSGVSQAQEQLLTWTCGMARIPMTRLFGTSAKGMSATGDGDERVYYDRISDEQEDVRPALNAIDQVMIRSEFGSYPDDLEFEFNPLAQLNEEQQATVDYTNSQTDLSYRELGVINRSHIARRLQSVGRYDISDEEIQAMVIEEAAEPEPEDDFNLEPSNDPSGSDPAESDAA